MKNKRQVCPSCFHRWRFVASGDQVECPKCGFWSTVSRRSQKNKTTFDEVAIPSSATKSLEPLPLSASPEQASSKASLASNSKTDAINPSRRFRDNVIAVSCIVVFTLGIGIMSAIGISTAGSGQKKILRKANPTGPDEKHDDSNAPMNRNQAEVNRTVDVMIHWSKSQQLPPPPGQIVPPSYVAPGVVNSSNERQQFETVQLIRQGVSPSDARAFVDTLFEAEREAQRKNAR